MDSRKTDIFIIGAGMAGLSCASHLSEAGREIVLIDKGRGPGGRMSTRRAEIAGEATAFDHGAQYFTARDSNFRTTVKDWEKLGVAARWPAAGNDAWVGTPGMNGPIRAMAEPLGVLWNTRALAIERAGERWAIDAGDQHFRAKTVLVCVPAEQAYELLNGNFDEFAEVAAGVSSEPCWAVMAGFAEALGISGDILRSETGPVAWAARNSAKPDRTGRENWVFHASPQRSRELLDLPKEEVATILLDDFFSQTGAQPASPIHLTAHRWLYARPAALSGEAARFDHSAGIGIAGDYLHSPRVEGAWLSGRALAERVLAGST